MGTKVVVSPSRQIPASGRGMDQDAAQTCWLEETTVRSPALVSTPNAGSKNQSLRKTLLTDGASFEPNNEQTTLPEGGIAPAD